MNKSIRYYYITLIASIVFYVPSYSYCQQRTIHVYVALADNANQGISPVPAKIGNGDDPANNLYWGCDEGLKTYFGRCEQWKLIQSSDWRKIADKDTQTSIVLERCIYKHVGTNTYLIADAYRGKEIRTAITEFMDAVSGKQRGQLRVTVNNHSVDIPIAGNANLIAYIGHNGLMDFDIPRVDIQGSTDKQVIVLCCLSLQYFGERIKSLGATPLLLTTQLMYPGSFILKNALDGWLLGESATQIRKRAAQSYAQNQNISQASALKVFSAP